MRHRRAERDAARVGDVRRLLLEAEQAIDTVPELQTDLDANRAALSRLETELAAANARASAAAARVEELVGSTSWRVTAPMRWLSDRLRR